MEIIKIESLDMQARGVGRKEDGKVVFIEGALPFERIRYQTHKRKNRYEQGSLVSIERPSSLRVQPRCPHFGLHQGACGGCKMQHLDGGAQVAVKARILEDNLWHLAKVKAQTVLPPVQGPDWGYRFRARLSVRYVEKKQTVLIGFHERKSRYIADMQSCAVLPSAVSALLLPLRELIGSLDAKQSCPQIELACVDSEKGLLAALVLRHLEPLSDADKARLRDFANTQSSLHIEWWLQAKGPDSVVLLDEGTQSFLAYSLPEFGITMPFKPTDFTQVNPYINQTLVSTALRYLEAQPQDRVIDWFCGLGNFTLPIASQAGDVLGVEGSQVLVERAQANAMLNANALRGAMRSARPSSNAQALDQGGHASHCQPKVDFVARNLFEMTPELLIKHGQADKWLVDPPREGAFSLVKALADVLSDENFAAHRGNWKPPKRIVYVSCNPATLARDAGILVHLAGYFCSYAGVVNMFPHTAHVESIAVFDKVHENDD